MEEPFILLRWNSQTARDAAGRPPTQKLTVHLANLCGYAVPDFWLKLTAFFELPQTSAFAASFDSPRDETGGSRAIDKTELSVTARLSNTRLIFVEDIADPSSRGIATHLDLNFHKLFNQRVDPNTSATPGVLTRAVTNFSVKNWQVFVCPATAPVPSSTHSIVRPCDIRFDLLQDNYDAVITRKLSGRVDAVELRASLETLKLLLKLADNVQIAFDRTKTNNQDVLDKIAVDLAIAKAHAISSGPPLPVGHAHSSVSSLSLSTPTPSPIPSPEPRHESCADASPSPAAPSPSSWMLIDPSLLPQPIITEEEGAVRRSATSDDLLPQEPTCLLSEVSAISTASRAQAPSLSRPIASPQPQHRARRMTLSSVKMTTEIELEVVGFSLILINDLSGRLMPLVALYIPRFKFNGADSIPTPCTRNLTVNSALGVQANFYNPSRAEWELLMEQTSVSIDFILATSLTIDAAAASADPSFVVVDEPIPAVPPQMVRQETLEPATIGPAWASSTRVDVKIPKSVGFNVSYDLLCSLSNLIPTWRQEYLVGSTDTSRLRSFSPFYVRNDTGVQLTFWFGSTVGQRENGTIVLPATEVPLDVQRFVPDLVSRQLVSDASLVITVQLDGPFEPICGLNITRVRSSPVLLSARNSPAPLRAAESSIEVDVSLRDGSKVIALRAPLRMINYSTIALEFKPANGPEVIVGPTTESAPCFVAVWRGGSGDWSDVYCRPSGMGELATWSNVPIPAMRLADLYRRQSIDHIDTLLQCAIGGSPIFFVLSTTVRPGHLRCFDIEIRPPFTLKNLFPLRTVFRMCNIVDKTIVSQGSLQPGQQAQIHEIGSGPLFAGSRARAPNLQLSFTVDDHRPSPWFSVAFDGDSVTTEVAIQPVRTARDGEHKTTPSPQRPHHRLFKMRVRNERGQSGVRIVSLLASVWLVNRTDLPLFYGSERNRHFAPLLPSQVKGICLLDECPDEGGRVYLAAPGYSYNRLPISVQLDAPVLDGVVSLASRVHEDGEHEPARADTRAPFYEVAVQFDRPSGRFSSTRSITFLPRFIVLNTLPQALLMSQAEAPFTDAAITWLLPAVENSFSWFSYRLPLLACVAFEGWHISCPFPIDQVGEMPIKILNKQQRDPSSIPEGLGTLPISKADIFTVRVKVEISRSQIRIIFYKEDFQFAPYRIENQTPFPLRFRQDTALDVPPSQQPPLLLQRWQTMTERAARKRNRTPWPVMTLPAMHFVPYTWEEQQLPGPRGLLFNVLGTRFRVDLDNPKFFRDLQYDDGMCIRAHTYADGPTQVLHFEVLDKEAQHEAKRKAAALSVLPAGVPRARALQIEVTVHEIIFSVHGKKGHVLTNVGVRDIFFLKTRSANHDEFHECSINSVQVDNAQVDARYPVTLRTIVGPMPFFRVATFHSFASHQTLLRSLRLRRKLRRRVQQQLEALQTLRGLTGDSLKRAGERLRQALSSGGDTISQLAAAQAEAQSSMLMQYDSVELRLQSFLIVTDDTFLYSLLGFVQDIQTDSATLVARSANSTASNLSGEEQLDRELMRVLNFSSAAGVTPTSRTSSAAPSDVSPLLYIDRLDIGALSCSLTFSVSSTSTKKSDRMLITVKTQLTQLTSVKDAPVRIDEVKLYRVFSSRKELVERLTLHYRSHLLPTALRLLGSVEFLGNPVGLINNLGTGFDSFAKQAFSGGPMGVARGTLSLMKSTVSGVSGSVAGVTKGMSGAVATLTFDKEFLEDRASRIDAEDRGASSFLKGMQSGGKHLATGFFRGIADVFVKPVRGAQSSGASGFFSGLGKGVVGLAVKPVVGVVDATTSVVKSMQRSVNKEQETASVRHIPSRAAALPSVSDASDKNVPSPRKPPPASPLLGPAPTPLPPSSSAGVGVAVSEAKQRQSAGPSGPPPVNVIRVGNWLYGALDGQHLVVQYRTRTVFVLTSEGKLKLRDIRGQARPEYLVDARVDPHRNPESTALSLGPWVLGPSLTEGWSLSVRVVFFQPLMCTSFLCR